MQINTQKDVKEFHLPAIPLCVQVLKEKLRKYKHRNQGLDDELTKRTNQVLVLEDNITALKRQLQVRGRRGAGRRAWVGEGAR